MAQAVSRWPGLSPSAGHVGLAVGKVALGQVLLHVLQVFRPLYSTGAPYFSSTCCCYQDKRATAGREPSQEQCCLGIRRARVRKCRRFVQDQCLPSMTGYA